MTNGRLRSEKHVALKQLVLDYVLSVCGGRTERPTETSRARPEKARNVQCAPLMFAIALLLPDFELEQFGEQFGIGT